VHVEDKSLAVMSQRSALQWDATIPVLTCLELTNSGRPWNIALSTYILDPSAREDHKTKVLFNAKSLPQHQLLAHLHAIHEAYLICPSYSSLIDSATQVVQACPGLLDMLVEILQDGYLEANSYIVLRLLRQLLEASGTIEVSPQSAQSETFCFTMQGQTFIQLEEWLRRAWLPASGLVEYVLTAKKLLQRRLKQSSESDGEPDNLVELDSVVVDYDAVNALAQFLHTKFDVKSTMSSC